MKPGRLLCLFLPLATTCWAASPRYVADPEISLTAQTANDTTIERVQLWVSTDTGQDWQLPDTAPTAGPTVSYTAPADGRYDFYLVLENAAGTSGPAPQAGTTPTVSVIVDTTPPLLQVHDITPPDKSESFTIQATLVEEHLNDDGLRVFYRSPGAPWQDGGPALRTGELASWDPPNDLPPDAELRLVATDLAGNRSASAPVSVVAPTTQPTSAPTVAIPDPVTTPSVELDPVTTPAVPAVTVPQVEPLTPTLPDEPREKSPATPRKEPVATKSAPPNAHHLRTLAAQFMQQGDYRLALARLQDALEIEPENADLLVDLGSALYRQHRYTEARERFQTAAELLPNHVGALDGLALVAATQKQYPQAREHLQRLQELLPDSGIVWLRTGDIEHKLGHSVAALRAWERACQAANADAEVRSRAQRRLDYFRPRPPRPVSQPARQSWPTRNNPRLSSSSTETTSTRSTQP